MEVYIGNKKVRCEMPITYTAALDETFDNASIVIPFSYRRKPFAPRSQVRIITDTETLYFRLVNDTVNLVSRGDKNVYQHTITLVELTSDLSTKLIKNICCYQPAEDTQVKSVAIACEYLNDVGFYVVPQTLSFEFARFNYVPKLSVKVQFYQIQTREFGPQTIDEKIAISGSINVFINNEAKTLNTDTIYSLDTSLTTLDIAINETTAISFTSSNVLASQVIVLFTVEREFYNYNFIDIVEKIRITAMQFIYGTPNKEEPFASINTSSDLYKMLNVKAPNFTFTQCTVFDALQQVFLYFDGIPRLKVNNELDIEFFNQFKIEKDNEKLVDERLSLSADTFVNGIVGDLANMVLEKPITYPSKTGYIKPRPIRAGKYDDKEIAIVLPRPINKLNHVWCVVYEVYGINEVSSQSARKKIESLEVDILPILKTNEELALLPDTAGHNELSKNNTLAYSRGSNVIGVATATNSYGFIEENLHNGLQIAIAQAYGVSSEHISFRYDAIESYSFRVEYEPMISTRLKSESLEKKYDGEIYSNQSSIEPSLSKIGRNMFGLSLKYGNEEVVRTKKITTFNDRYKIGDNYDIGSERYIVNTATTTFFNGYIVSSATLTKDFNKLSSYLSVDEKKRFTNIDRSIAIDSRDVMSDYLVYDSSESRIPSSSIYKGLTKNAIYSMFDSVVSNNEVGLRSDLATFRPLRKIIVNGTTYFLNITDTDVSMPFVSYGIQNSFVFDFAFDDPMSAGVIKGDIVNGIATTQAVPYTSENGTFEAYDLDIITLVDTDFAFDGSFPKLNETTLSNITREKFFEAEEIIDKKDANEITKLTYQLLFVPYTNNDTTTYVFGKTFFEDNKIFGRNAKATKLVILDNYISQFDDKVDPFNIKETYELDNTNNRVVRIVKNNNAFGIRFERYDYGEWQPPMFDWEELYYDDGEYVLDYNRRAFVLIDDDNNILIAKNNYGYDGENFEIYFSYQRRR